VNQHLQEELLKNNLSIIEEKRLSQKRWPLFIEMALIKDDYETTTSRKISPDVV